MDRKIEPRKKKLFPKNGFNSEPLNTSSDRIMIIYILLKYILQVMNLNNYSFL